MHEIKSMKGDETINRRIITSYQLMLDFYGMRLENEATGLISRSENYAAQYKNLCSTYFCPDLVLRYGLPYLNWADVSCRAICATFYCPEMSSYPSVHFVSPSTVLMLPLNRYAWD